MGATADPVGDVDAVIPDDAAGDFAGTGWWGIVAMTGTGASRAVVAGCLSPMTGTTTLSPNRDFFAPVAVGLEATGLCDAVGIDPDFRSRID